MNDGGELFNELGLDSSGGRIKFGVLLTRFYGRELSGIRLRVKDPKARAGRHEVMFTKKAVEQQSKLEIFGVNNGIDGLDGIVLPAHHIIKINKMYNLSMEPIPFIPTIPSLDSKPTESSDKIRNYDRDIIKILSKQPETPDEVRNQLVCQGCKETWEYTEKRIQNLKTTGFLYEKDGKLIILEGKV